MSRAYGKPPQRSRSRPEAPQPVEIQVNLTLRHTMEQLALEVQRALYIVEQCGAEGVENFRFRLLPLDKHGVAMVLRDEHGRQITTVNIPNKPVAPAYRDNEPGVGVNTVAPHHPGTRQASRVGHR